MTERFGYKNAMQVPRLEKIVLNMGVGDATQDKKRVDTAAYDAVLDVVDGTFEGGVQNLGLAEDGVGYALDDYNRALVPQAVVDELEAVREQIVSGEVVVTDFRTQ